MEIVIDGSITPERLAAVIRHVQARLPADVYANRLTLKLDLFQQGNKVQPVDAHGEPIELYFGETKPVIVKELDMGTEAPFDQDQAFKEFMITLLHSPGLAALLQTLPGDRYPNQPPGF